MLGSCHIKVIVIMRNNIHINIKVVIAAGTLRFSYFSDVSDLLLQNTVGSQQTWTQPKSVVQSNLNQNAIDIMFNCQRTVSSTMTNNSAVVQTSCLMMTLTWEALPSLPSVPYDVGEALKQMSTLLIIEKGQCQVLFTADILTCHGRKNTAVSWHINNLFKL